MHLYSVPNVVEYLGLTTAPLDKSYKVFWVDTTVIQVNSKCHIPTYLSTYNDLV